ncbi:hypothetical protein JNJ66_00795 [Candidatus Saccharibacteria bacterium]|nr:hypothetical protein [Candidatus Saccharibacteria bacterium]
MLDIYSGNGSLLYLVVIAGLLHACLQLPLATLVQVATHALGRRKHEHVGVLSFLVVFGYMAAIVSMVLISAVLLITVLNSTNAHQITGIITAVAGLAIMTTYFREGSGAALWLPRRFAHTLYAFSEKPTTTESYGHAAMAGFTAGWFEAIFAFPLVLSTTVLAFSPGAPDPQISLLYYCLAASVIMLIAAIALASNASPTTLLRWRAANKRFWQLFTGMAFLLFGLYVTSGQYAVMTVQTLEAL